MPFWKDLSKSVGNAVSFVGEKSRRAAQLNRIRSVIQCEERAAEKEYLALGRYYYNNLRDEKNSVTEAHCAELESIEKRLDRALQLLERFYSDGEEDSAACICAGQREEIDLEDIECMDAAPQEIQMVDESMAPVQPAPQEADTEPGAAETDENDNLPFEG